MVVAIVVQQVSDGENLIFVLYLVLLFNYSLTSVTENYPPNHCST